VDRVQLSQLGNIELSRNLGIIILIGKIDEVKGLLKKGAFILMGTKIWVLVSKRTEKRLFQTSL